jgi:hypothetical protein
VLPTLAIFLFSQEVYRFKPDKFDTIDTLYSSWSAVDELRNARSAIL